MDILVHAANGPLLPILWGSWLKVIGAGVDLISRAYLSLLLTSIWGSSSTISPRRELLLVVLHTCDFLNSFRGASSLVLVLILFCSSFFRDLQPRWKSQL